MSDDQNTSTTSPTPASTPAPSPAATPTANILANVEVAILVDTSGTMRKKDVRGGNLTRLQAVRESAAALADELEKYDDDGITIVRFAGTVELHDNVTRAGDKLDNLFEEFRPMGSTNTAGALQKVIDKFLDKRQAQGNIKPACIICFTDGEPDDKLAVAKVIVDATKRIKSRDELGILFVQVGSDQDATDYLDKLNSHLTEAGATLDIVAVKKLDDLEKLTPEEIVKIAFTE